jgi:AcrR family transcriptional regulator
MSAEERREETLAAAICAFAKGGYEGTSTAQIAERVGVSQPYLFRLFPSKRALFLAAVERCFDTMEEAMRDAAGGLYGKEAMVAMGARYRELLANSTVLQFQLQIFAAAIDDEEVRHIGNTRWASIWRTVAEMSGEPPQEVLRFVSVGMLLNVLVAFDIPYSPGEKLAQSLRDWSADA